jgi:hypothetical protein
VSADGVGHRAVRAWLTDFVRTDGQPNQPTIERIRELLAASWERASELAGGSLGRADDVLKPRVWLTGLVPAARSRASHPLYWRLLYRRLRKAP